MGLESIKYPKLPIALSAYTNEDSEGNAMLKTHAYKAATDGRVTGFCLNLLEGQFINVYVGTTNNPAGAGDRIETQKSQDNSYGDQSVSALVAKDSYFEITCSLTPTIRWISFGTLSKPVDQD